MRRAAGAHGTLECLVLYPNHRRCRCAVEGAPPDPRRIQSRRGPETGARVAERIPAHFAHTSVRETLRPNGLTPTASYGSWLTGDPMVP